MTENVPDRMNLKSVDRSIQENLLSVNVQPSMNPRRRYKSEGKRRIKKLRGDLITLNVCLFFFFSTYFIFVLVINAKSI
jgi:hypothetical protein